MMSLRLMIRAPLLLLFAVVIAININAGLASIIAIAIPVLAVSIYFISAGVFLFLRKYSENSIRLMQQFRKT